MTDPSNLRRRAEAKLELQDMHLQGLSSEDVGRLLYELRTHQIELEMQNEELLTAQEALLASRDRYAELYDFAPIGYLTVNDAGLIVEANLRMAGMLQIERSSLVSQRLSSFIVPDDQDIFYRHRREAKESQRRCTCELRMRSGKVEPFWIEMKSIMVGVDDGDGPRLQSAILEITERHLAEQALRKANDDLELRVADRTAELAGTIEVLKAEISRRSAAEERVRERDQQLRSIMEAAPDGIAVTVDNEVAYCNRALGQILGCPAESLVGKSIVDFIHPDDLDAAVARARALLSGGPEYPSEYRLRKGDGTVLPVATHTARTTFGGNDALVTIIRDMTRAKRTETELLDSRERLRQLTDRLQKSVEEERRWVSAEIHDELGQTMTALAIDLRWLLDRLPEGQYELSDHVVKMETLLDSTLDSVQRIVFHLRPPLLDDLGLVAAIQWLAEDFAERIGVKCSTALPRVLDLDAERATTVFRISQEALTNVARHAAASEVHLALRVGDGNIELAVEDDGRGLPVVAESDAGSFGLLGMQERARALGGSVDVVRVGDAGGTLVRLSLPLGSPTVADGAL